MVEGEFAAVDSQAQRRVRADAQRNLAAVLKAAKALFAETGPDATVRDIAKRAGVGLGTVYRHYPRRVDLIAAVFEQEMEACAAAAEQLGAEYPPAEAMALWMSQFVVLASTKHGLADALHSNERDFDFMPTKASQRLWPAFRALFEAAVTSGEIRNGVDADDFLNAAAALCRLAEGRPDQARKHVMLLFDGLRCSTTEILPSM